MKFVVFGLVISSSWGNGHATLWRGLVSALTARGCSVQFFERDETYYAAHRDLDSIAGGRLVLYPDWEHVKAQARRAIVDADAVIVTSYCPDAIGARDLAAEAARPVRVFYDLDSPVTLARLAAGEDVPYIGRDGLGSYDLVLSFAGGGALHELSTQLGARRVAPLYGHVDPSVHAPVKCVPRYRSDLSYLGTYAPDRQPQLERLFVRAAAEHPERRFLIGGAQYPQDFPWHPNIWFVSHLPPGEHPAFFSSSRLTLNVTRAAMARMGWCPSGRVFEAAACATPVITDAWEGLSSFYAVGAEILVARDACDVAAALSLGDGELARIGRAARERTLAEHTSAHRAAELVALIETARQQLETVEAHNA